MLNFFSVFLFLLNLSCASMLKTVVSEGEVLEKLELNQNKITSFRGGATVDFSLNQKKGSVEVIVVAKNSGEIRLETGNFFGVPLTVLAIKQGKLSYYNISEEKIYVGEAKNLSTVILPLRLSDHDLLGLLLFSKQTVLKLKKDPHFTLEFLGFKKDDEKNAFYPTALKLTNQKSKDFLEVSWEGYDFNPQNLSDELFQIKKPPQARIIYWKEGQTTPLLQGQEELN